MMLTMTEVEMHRLGNAASNNRPIIGQYRLMHKPDNLTLIPKIVSIIQIFYCIMQQTSA